ncbi:MAG: LbtU family siderophore porin [Gammaproteobacteria bacterium]|nr:LbtU family siderophore porin [Gammaproteobacteria bacterium]
MKLKILMVLSIGLLFSVADGADSVKSESAESPYIANLVSRNIYLAVGPLVTPLAAYDASDVIYNLSVTNLDLALLQSKKILLTQLKESDLTLSHPMLQLSAGVGGEFFSLPAFTVNAAGNFPIAGVALAGAQIDTNAIITPWVNSFIAISDGGNNASIDLASGFLTIGNLTVTPIYFSLGLLSDPFTYSPSGLSTAALPASMMTINSPTFLLGYSKNNFMAAIYGYMGSEVIGGQSPIKQVGAETYYKLFFGKNAASTLKIGLGVVTNVADADGFQNTYYSTQDHQFDGFGGSTSSNNLAHSVDGGDINAKLLTGRWTLIGEYADSLRQFSEQDLSFDNHGAQPGSARIELRYALPFIPQKYGAFLGTAWDHTMQALALNFEEDKYALFFNTAIWRMTMLKLEYDRQQDYAASQSGSGLGATAPIVGTGKGVNVYSLELWAYF